MKLYIKERLSEMSKFLMGPKKEEPRIVEFHIKYNRKEYKVEIDKMIEIGLLKETEETK